MTQNEAEEKFKNAYATWNAFLTEWPLERLRTMSLAEYTQAGGKDAFTYWLEIKLEDSGSIWGGSAFKFGIFSRKDKAEREPVEGLSYSDNYAWYSRHGKTAEEAFSRVRSIVVSIAEAAAVGDLAAIDLADFGTAVKWKIAFHYQNRERPTVVGAFKPQALAAFLGRSGPIPPLHDLYTEALDNKEPAEDILEFGARVWRAWASKDLDIWKLSHGGTSFSASELDSLKQQRLAVLYENTGKKQAKRYIEVPVGTLFYLCHGNSMQLLGRFTSAVEPSNRADGGWLQRRYEVLKLAIKSDQFDQNAKNWTPRGNSTFWQVKKHELLEFEDMLLRPYFQLNLEDVASLEPTPSSDEDVESMEKSVGVALAQLAGPLNRILYGPPGTGKTFRSVAEAVAIVEGATPSTLMSPSAYAETKKRFDAYRASEQIEFVTFHPSYAYQDFIEGIRPQPTADGGLSYDVDPGVLRRIAEKARTNWEASRISTGNVMSDDERFEQAYANVLTDIEESEKGFVTARLFRGFEGQVRVGAKERSLSMVLPGYPTVYNLPKQQLKNLWVRRGEIKTPSDTKLYNRSFFWAILRLLESTDTRTGALTSPNKTKLRNYVLVIDEINRGNIAKIFGELITLIEDDKRLGEDNELTVRLPYSPDERGFGLPPNLYLIGTMNTADRSIALIDTALRRRFTFIELMPDPSVLAGEPLADVDVVRLLTMINARIEYLFDREHTIGHAYFCGVGTFKELAERIQRKIIPLLQEYFHDDWSKIRLVFNDGAHKPDGLHVVRGKRIEPDNLFSDCNQDFETRTQYAIADELTPQMVRAVYE
jgi:5-methylcytosine-specific restriction protein B